MLASPANTCAEKIAILRLLHEVPEPPFKNPPAGASSSFSNQYSLPFERERNLCSTLAFLSCTADDPDRIPALCLHECPTKPALNVLVAVNSAQFGDGLATLRNIEAGFGTIFSLLSQTPHDKENDVFAAIVSMCSVRIRERTHLVDKEATRQTLKQLLQDAMRALPSFGSFLNRARELLAKINLWLLHQTLARLQDMVESVQHLSRLDHLSNMLDLIPNREMDPGSRKSLLNMIRKLARYRDAARYLCRTAKKFPVVRRMEMQIVTLPHYGFPATPSLSNAEQTTSVATLQLTKKQRKQFIQCLRVLAVSEAEAFQQITERKSGIISKGKVHAEIQLIHHLETPRSQPPPRVICSNKDACFLCNAFITMQGKFYTPRCHGRLYPNWRLPVFTPTSDLEQRFVNALNKVIQQSLHITLQRQKKITNPYPLESTVPTISLSNSTLVVSENGAVDDTVRGESQTTGNILESLVSGGATPKEQLPADQPYEEQCQPARQRDETVPIHIQSATQRTKRVSLPFGKQLAVTVQANASSVLYEAWPIILQIEFSVQTPDRDTQRTLTCRLERLREDDADAVRITQNATILDGDLLQEGLTIRPKDFQNFYISARGTLLRVSVS